MPETLTMTDGAQVSMLTEVEMAERLVIDAVDEVMKEPMNLWTNEIDLNAKCHLSEAYRKLEYARFYQSGRKLEEGELRLP